MTWRVSEAGLIAAAARLAGDPGTWSAAERRLARTPPAPSFRKTPSDPPPSGPALAALRTEITAGGDPLGEAFCRIRSPKTRRAHGATYTPMDIVSAMVGWAADGRAAPARVVDPGAGSGRFLAAAARVFPQARLVAVETDPVAALMLRATATAGGFADRLTLMLADYRGIDLPRIAGATLFIGNPPYVRHHDIGEDWKRWYAAAAAGLGVKASKLAGLHLHFFFKTMTLADEGDYGAFITAAEWLDVTYGRALRQLLAGGLGGTSLHVLDPTVTAFADAATTAAITCFEVGRRPKTFRVRAVKSRDSLNGLTKGRAVPWSEVEQAARWSLIVRPARKPPAGYIALGDLFRVHRGQVTGANSVWIAGAHAEGLPGRYVLPTVTKARDLLDAGDVLADAGALRRVIDLPVDLDALPSRARGAVDRFLAWARTQHADSGYIARARRAWWSVGLREPAPIVCTYMARRPPAFVRNLCGARLLNIAHGLYPREPLPDDTLTALIAWLNANVRLDAGRAYAGGLTKFEPGEVLRIAIPRLERLGGGRESCEHSPGPAREMPSPMPCRGASGRRA